MIKTFASLKWRLVLNGLKKQRRGRVVLVLAPLIGLVIVVPVFNVLAQVRHHPVDAYTVAAVTLGAIFAGWVVLPILGFGSDDTLDPGNLALLPLTHRQIAAGMLVASAIGLAPLGTFVTLVGAVIGFGTSPAAAVIAVAAVVVMVAACLVASRLFVTSLSGLLRSRRGRDIGISVGALLGVGVQLLRFVLVDRDGHFEAQRLHGVVPYIAWTPPGLLARTLDDARVGRPGSALLALSVAAVQVVLLAAVWGAVLERVLTSPETSTQREEKRSGSASFPGLTRHLPPNRVGVVALKELRYLARDPRRRGAIIPSVVLPLVPILSVLRAGGSNPKLVMAAAFTTLLGGIAVFNNQFGTDGPAYWLHVAVDGGARDDLTGKNLAALALGVPIPIAAGVILAIATGGWAYLPFMFVVSIGVLGVLLGVGNVVSVRLPQPLPESRANMWATRSGQGCAIALISLAVIAVEGILLLPLMIGTFLAVTSLPGLKPAVGAVAVLYGWGMWWVGRNVAATWLAGHQPEMLERLSPKQA